MSNTLYKQNSQANLQFSNVGAALELLTFVLSNEPQLAAMFRRWAAAYSTSLMSQIIQDHDHAFYL